jgi:hypothetical protein
MRAFFLAMAVVVAGSAGALASCPSIPDNASTGYVENQQALALCRQREVSDRLAIQQQQQVEIQGQINWLNTQIRLNEQFSRAQQALPQF